jgi:hypothetical protein
MRAEISACLSIIVLGATSGCEEVRVRPEGLDEEGESSLEEMMDVPPPLGDLDLPEARRPVALAAGYYNTCAVLGDGRVACFGDNRAAFEMGEPGRGLFVVDGVSEKRGAALGKHRACAWTDGGPLSCWPGRYGRGRAEAVGMPHVKQAAVGGGHLCALLEDRHVRCIGDDNWLQSNTRFASRAFWVDGVENAVEVATGATHSCARHEDGSVTCWGDNRRNQMGDGSNRVRALPRRVPGIAGATQIASHGFAVQTCALDGEGTITCWGSYGVERAGGTTRLGEEHEVLPPIADERVAQIGVGPWEVCAVTESGRVYCHRQSLESARGDEAPVYGGATQVEGLEEATAVTVGAMHACVLLADGDVACWGENTHGQLGDGTRQERTRPVLATVLAGEPARSGGEGS